MQVLVQGAGQRGISIFRLNNVAQCDRWTNRRYSSRLGAAAVYGYLDESNGINEVRILEGEIIFFALNQTW